MSEHVGAIVYDFARALRIMNGTEVGQSTDVVDVNPDGALAGCFKTFSRWLGATYDQQSLLFALSIAAVERLTGDPVWGLIVSGPGNAKTETVSAFEAVGGIVVSTITSEGALLSATARSERTPDATGGLLRRMGNRGILVLKDFTSILSMQANSRDGVIAALREVYDGRWARNVGTDGGRTLEWEGRIVLIGAVTTAYDSKYAVIAAMGDRFALCRVASDDPAQRRNAGMMAMRGINQEVTMREELRAVVKAVIDNACSDKNAGCTDTAEDTMMTVFDYAEFTTLTRRAVEHDFRGEVSMVHEPEAATRFSKNLMQIIRGAMSVGASENEGLRLARRVARDSVPPLRLDVLRDVCAIPDGERTRVADVTRRLSKPRNTIARTMMDLIAIGLLRHEPTVQVAEGADPAKVPWQYWATDEAREMLRLVED